MPRTLRDVVADFDRALARLEKQEDQRQRTRTLEHLARLTREGLVRLNQAVLVSPPVL
jgi:hypothetical protein